MSDQPTPNNNLSEISHLFLSSVRDRHTAGTQRPQRKPPGAPQASNDQPTIPQNELSQQELEAVNGPARAEPRAPAPPIRAVIAPHLNGKQLDYVKRYARFLAADDQRIGLIEIDVSEFRLMTFERGQSDSPAFETAEFSAFDGRAMSDAISELNNDVDCWLLLLCNPRLPEARDLLRKTDGWTVLTTCDHDGVVGAYRTLKSMADLHRPPLTVAMLDARNIIEADQIYQKLNGVCEQFLHWPLVGGEAVTDPSDVVEHLVMCCRPMTDKAQVAAATHWQVVGRMLDRAADDLDFNEAEHISSSSAHALNEPQADVMLRPIEPPAVPAADPWSSSDKAPMKLTPAPDPASNQADEVVDLPDGALSETAVLSAVLQRLKNDLAECPIRPPMCEGARLAINRERRLVLLAVDRPGLSDLRSIAGAYRWLNENRRLVAMALPQFSIDAEQMPQLRLLVDQCDANAELLQPMLQAHTVQIQTYRRVRWGGRTGLLLQAA